MVPEWSLKDGRARFVRDRSGATSPQQRIFNNAALIMVFVKEH